MSLPTTHNPRLTTPQLATLAIFICWLMMTRSTQAGGPLVTSYAGEASRWDNDVSISLHPESGVCAGFSSPAMLNKLDEMADVWTGLSLVDLNIDAVAGVLGAIDEDNYGTYVANVDATVDEDVAIEDGINPVIYDESGDIIAQVAGEANRYYFLGFASPAAFSDDYTEILDGWLIINCRCFEGNANGACPASGGGIVIYSESTLDFIILHELGHFLNLDHTQVNDHLIDSDISDDDPLPTMYPLAESEAAQMTPQQDDIVALATLYPAGSFTSSTCLVTGKLLDRDGNPLRCADVQALTNNEADTVAHISGTYAEVSDDNGDGDTTDTGECLSDCGYFELHLTPGKDYTIALRAMSESLTAGSGMGPCSDDPLTSIGDEDIAQVAAEECVAGETLALGEIDTDATGGVIESRGGADDDDNGSGADSDGGGGFLSCTLRVERTGKSSHDLSLVSMVVALTVLVVYPRQRRLRG